MRKSRIFMYALIAIGVVAFAYLFSLVAGQVESICQDGSVQIEEEEASQGFKMTCFIWRSILSICAIVGVFAAGLIAYGYAKRNR